MKKCCNSPKLIILLNSLKHNKNQALGELSTMRNGKTVLAQMQEIISRYNFEKVVFMHNGDKGVKKFKTHNLLTIMLYAQMTAKMSLRDICYGLKSKMNYWYHLSINSISRNNLSHALSKRPAEMFENIFYQLLIKLKVERGIINDKRFKFKNPLRSIDSTTISLCLSLFEWAKFRRAKGGIKLHTMFNNKEQVPEFMIISEAREHDINIAYDVPIQEGAIYVMDKAYMCYDFLEKIRENRAFFVTRTKKNTLYKIIERRKKTGTGIKADWIVEITGSKVKDYSGQLRVVRYYDSETKQAYEYYTNNFNLSAKTIANIYKSRWDIEIFFKFIKQNLKIKTFFGTSENAVRIQIWTAMIALLLVEYIRFKCRSTFSLQKSWRILKDNVFQQYRIESLLTELSVPKPDVKTPKDIQLALCF